eukprot:scaffold162879_cov17-Tisochrysis_lutea.AAC.1
MGIVPGCLGLSSASVVVSDELIQPAAVLLARHCAWQPGCAQCIVQQAEGAAVVAGELACAAADVPGKQPVSG